VAPHRRRLHDLKRYDSVNMDDQKIRQIVRDELNRRDASSRFALKSIPNHTHNGVDSLPIQANNIIPSSSVTGSLTLSAVQEYTIQLNASFTPQSILAYGIATGDSGATAWRVISIGSAQLTPTFYLQDPTDAATPDNYVITGELQFPFRGKPAQSSVFHSTRRGSNTTFYAGNSEDHIVSIFDGLTESDIQARVTVTGFSKTSITLDVPILEAGWEVILNFVIT